MKKVKRKRLRLPRVPVPKPTRIRADKRRHKRYITDTEEAEIINVRSFTDACRVVRS